MNAVEVALEGVEAPGRAEQARAFALEALKALGRDGWDLSILLCGDDFIRDLNRRFRGRDEPTDVLSFEQGGSYRGPEGEERFLAGDIAISLDTMYRNADGDAIPREDELRRLVVHGILHLGGMDHPGDDPSCPMLALQEELLGRLSRGEASR